MSTLVFPAGISTPDYSMPKKYEDTSIGTPYEDGNTQTRTKFTRSRDTWTVRWEKMPQAQYLIYDDFVKNKAKFKANPFLWTNPATGVTSEVILTNAGEPEIVELDKWKIEMTIQEV